MRAWRFRNARFGHRSDRERDQVGKSTSGDCKVASFPPTNFKLLILDSNAIVRENAIVGHGAVLHDCEIGANALIGINTVVLDGAVVGSRSIVGAIPFVRKRPAKPVLTELR